LSAAGVTGYWVQQLSATSPTQAWSTHSGSATHPTPSPDLPPTSLAALQAPAGQHQQPLPSPHAHTQQLQKQAQQISMRQAPQQMLHHIPHQHQPLLQRALPQVSATSGLGSLSSLEIDQLLALDAGGVCVWMGRFRVCGRLG
jgi:hypothetical protein